MIKYILIFGFFRFLLDLTIHQVFYHSKYIYEPWSGSVIFIAQMFLTVLFIIFAVFIFKRRYEGYKDFGHLFILIFSFIVFSEIIGSFYDYWFQHYYDPDFLLRYVQAFKEKFPEYGKRQGYTDKEIQDYLKNEYPKMLAAAKKIPTFWEILKERLVSGGIQGFFMGGILGFIMRDRNIREFL